MKRRNTIKLMALGTGAIFAVPLVSNLMTSCKSETKETDVDLQFFTSEELPVLKVLVDTIIPESAGSPSASAVGVHLKIDEMVSNIYDSNQKAVFKSNFSALKTYLNSVENTDFLDLEKEKQTTVIHDLIADKTDSSSSARESILNIKDQSINFYLNTEVIAKNQLNYLPVPGPFLPCIPLEELNGKAWAI